MIRKRKWGAALALVACLLVQVLCPAGALAAPATDDDGPQQELSQQETSVLDGLTAITADAPSASPVESSSDAGSESDQTVAEESEEQAALAQRAVQEQTDSGLSRVWVQGYNAADGTICVRASGAPEGAAVRINAWLSGRPEDARTYEALSEDGRTFTVNVPIADFAYQEGWYEFSGTCGPLDSAVWTEPVSAPVSYARGTLRVDPADSTETTFTATLQGSSAPLNAVVWLKVENPAQGTSRVYPLLKRGDLRRYKLFVQHHRQAGTYTATAYLGMPTRVDKVLSTAQFRVDGVRNAQVRFADINGSTGALTMELAADAPSGIKSARFAVWSAVDRSDLKWYDAAADGSVYRADLNILDHSGFGQYTAQAHVELGNGVSMVAGEQTEQIDAHNYVYVEASGNGIYRLAVQGADPADPSQYRAAVWSDKNGQDDIVWYNASTDDEADVSIYARASRHASAGKFIAHVYCGDEFIGAAEFSVPEEELLTEAERRIAADCQKVYDLVGTDLHDNYMWVVNNFSYVRRYGHLTPASGYTREQWYAVEGLETQSGNCYSYAAAFCELAKGLGYDATYVEGAVFGVGQQWWPHGFVLITRNGGTYICDPELQYASSSGRNLYMQPVSSPKATYRW